MADIVLKPCPFCGGEAGIGTGPRHFFVNCVECLASTNLLTPEGLVTTKEEAAELWNNRVKEPRTECRREDVESTPYRSQF